MNRVKPTRVENEVDTGEFTCKGNKLQVTSTRFKTRIMQSSNQRVEVQGTVLGTTTTFTGRTRYVDGRAAQIALTSNFEGDILRVTTIGREEPTKLEKQREQVVLQLLQRTQSLFEHPFFQSMWLPDETPSWRSVPSCGKHQVPLYFPHTPLNDSQKQAVEAILSGKDEHRLTVIQGPPGSGKTTVIAAAVVSIAKDTDRTALQKSTVISRYWSPKNSIMTGTNIFTKRSSTTWSGQMSLPTIS
ncbi:hypothetical protein C8F01DRAFT_657051 [Mycena amicta]|nr:hypothetical protein C8F01DRAFT_657051 [Mycena amicta]